MTRTVDIAALYRQRPRSRLVRGTVMALAGLCAYAWLSHDIQILDLFEPRRLENLERFVRREILPFPLRGKDWSAHDLVAWAEPILASRGLPGALATFAIAVAAISLAGLAAAGLAPFATRTLASAQPFEDRSAPVRRSRAWAFGILSAVTRALLIFLRAIPEYVWAFLLLAMLGPSAWPAVLALAIHNAGILGKLGAETIENLDSSPLRALRMLGAERAQIGLFAIVPLSLSRFLLYFLYRFETCVREATVLGMLGVVSLGYWIQDARSKSFYDEMLLFIALGGAIVLVGDLASAGLRAVLRRAA